MSNQGLIICTDGTSRVFDVLPGSEDRDPNYNTIRDAVGGWIELVRVAEDLVIYCNEEGKMMHLPVNELATTVVLAIFRSQGVTWPDFLVGDVVFVGDDGGPNSVGITGQWVQAFKEINVWPEV